MWLIAPMIPRTPLETNQIVRSALNAISPALLCVKTFSAAKSIAR
jgi:hypothetical protein